jgi:hypothetical protein
VSRRAAILRRDRGDAHAQQNRAEHAQLRYFG